MNLMYQLEEIIEKIKLIPETHLFAIGAIGLGAVLILASIIMMI